MGTVQNVGLMAKAEEYGSHDKTFEIKKMDKSRSKQKTEKL